MSTVKLSQIRSRVSDALEGIAGAGLKQSPMSPAAFGRTVNTIAHKSFCVVLGGSTARDDRQRQVEGAMLETDMEIRVAYRLRPHDQITDTDGSMDLENTIIANLLNRGDADLYPNLHIRFLSSNRLLTDSGEYILSSMNFNLLHFIPLST
jgi:hypothetical protein